MRLLEWSLATFHTSFFFAVLILIAYLGGGLASLLASLNTLVGTAIFLVFWAITWFCTRRAIRSVVKSDQLLPIGSNEIRTAFLHGPLWGAVNGVVFLLVLAISTTIYAIFYALLNASRVESPEALAGSLIAVVFILPFALGFGTPIAFIVGAVFGFLFALIDGMLIGAAQALAKVFIPDPKDQANLRLAEDPLGLTRPS